MDEFSDIKFIFSKLRFGVSPDTKTRSAQSALAVEDTDRI